MRLRQLQTSQTVCFYGPREVDSSIRDFHRMKSPIERIDSAHVIYWLLEQTCRSIDDQKGLYAAQGIDFCQRTDTIWQCKKFMTNLSERQKLLKILKQPERKTLQELYGPALKKSATSLESGVTSPQLRSFVKKLTVHNKDGPDGTQVGAFEEVEQEREVEAEVEQVRQVEKRKKYDALSFPGMHPDVVQFAHTGILEASSKIQTQQPGFEHAFSFVGRTAIGKNFGVHSSNANLFVSREFTRTVQIAKSSHEGDNFIVSNSYTRRAQTNANNNPAPRRMDTMGSPNRNCPCHHSRRSGAPLGSLAKAARPVARSPTYICCSGD